MDETPDSGSVLHGSSERSLARLEAIIESAMDAIVTVDEKQTIVAFNPAAVALFGYPSPDIIGEPLDRLIPDRFRVQHRKHVRRFAASGDTSRSMGALGVLLGRRADGSEFPLEATISHVEVNGQHLLTAIVRDVSERVRLEEDLRQALQKQTRIAETLQRSLLIVPPAGAFPGLEVAPFYEPALDEASVGGDFYDIFSLPEGRVALVVGDVSGKGLAAAERTVSAKYALRAFIQEYPHPAMTLERLNRYLWDYADGVHAFITLILAVVDPATGETVVSVAGMEPPLVIRGDGTYVTVDSGGCPAGIEPQADYTAETIHLEVGDTLVLTTDGITEARNGGAFLGYEGLVRLALEGCRKPSLKEMGDAILAGAHIFSGGPLADDACLLLLRRETRWNESADDYRRAGNGG